MMKTKLTIFFAGFAAGLLAMCLVIGLTTDDGAGQHAFAKSVVQSNTNLMEPIHWKRTWVTFHWTQSNSAR